MDVSERIVNLAMHIASARRPVSAEEIRANVAGYPRDQDDAAFGRMFERDKEQLRQAGLVLLVDRAEGSERYRLDPAATYAGQVTLNPREAMELGAAGAAMLADPSFPFPEDLRFALAKIMAGADVPGLPSAHVTGALTADEDPTLQGETVARLAGAATSRKRASFTYTDAGGRMSDRAVEPWGLFASQGRWYLVAFDPAAPGPRTFAVPRMENVVVNASKPKTPDFELVADFDIRGFMRMPFQFGSNPVEATLLLSGAAARRAEALTAGQGRLTPVGPSTIQWRVPVADEGALATWVAENGPGIQIVEPSSARERLAAGLRKAEAAHG